MAGSPRTGFIPGGNKTASGTKILSTAFASSLSQPLTKVESRARMAERSFSVKRFGGCCDDFSTEPIDSAVCALFDFRETNISTIEINKRAVSLFILNPERTRCEEIRNLRA